MRYRTLQHWENIADLEGLIFFTQLLEELLFDYSLDTYKPSAMTSSSLCKEALNLINNIEAELIDKQNLGHVIKELVACLRVDEIATTLLDLEVNTVCSKLESEENSLIEKKIILQIIYSQITTTLYKQKGEELLSDAVAAGRDKKRIRSLTRSYISTLIVSGYSTRYLYPCVRWAFHSKAKPVREVSDLKNFFNFVTGKNNQYTAIFKVSAMFDEISDSCKEFEMKVVENLEGEYLEHAKSKNFRLMQDQFYLVIDDLKAKDVFSARSNAERRIEGISTLTNMFHHKEIPSWEKKALLINVDSQTIRLTSSAQNPMLHCSDYRKRDAATKLNACIKDFSLRERHSFQKFIRATELHSLALKNDSPENQLLNLWVGLETLAPSKLSKNKAKINKIIDSVNPFLSLDYIHILINRLTLDFKKWNIGAFSKSIRTISGHNDREKLIKLLLLDEHEEAKNKLFSDLGEFYLLRNRAHYFSETLKSTKKIAKLLNSHSKRTDWQIRRIYRARNLIVHAGHTPRSIDVLIKNLHDYLDIVTNGVLQLASNGEQINTIDQAFKYAEMQHQQYMDRLTVSETNIDSTNINRFILNKLI